MSETLEDFYKSDKFPKYSSSPSHGNKAIWDHQQSKIAQLQKEKEEILKDVKEVCDALEFCSKSLENFYPFKEWESGVKEGLDATLYQTLTQPGDQELVNKYKRARQCAPAIKRLYERIDLM